MVREGNRRGNPAWYRGMPSANPKGRPTGQTSLYAYCNDPTQFRVYLWRWQRFVWTLLEPPFTGAAAARKVGYSAKSARFIASRLLRNPVVKEMLRRIRQRIDGTRKIGGGVYLIPDDEGHYHVYRNPHIRKEVELSLKSWFISKKYR